MPLKLRHQTRSLIFIATAGLILVAVLLIASIHSSRFRSLEKRITQEAFECSISSARNAREAQARLNSDWAWWDASYRFVTEGDNNYLKEHVPPELLWENRLYFAAIVDRDLSIKWGATLGHKYPEIGPLTEEQEQVVMDIVRMNPIPKGQVLSGYTVLSGDITVAITVGEILKNDKSGPSGGLFLLASSPGHSWFGPSGHIRITPGSTGHAPQPLTIFGGKTIVSRQLPGFKSLEPAILTVIRPAAMIEAGDKLIQMSVFALILSGAIIGLATYSWITRKFINRIEFLKRQINIENPSPLRDSGDDEIGDLCIAFNDLLGTLKRQGEIHRLESLQDPLTGLANRRLLDEKLHQAIAYGKGPIALIMVDLDGFKGVNDSLGHSVGDELLRQVGERFNSLVGDKDTIARIGGDEFAVLAEEIGNEDNALTLCRRIRGILLQPFSIDNSSLQISASLGVALYPKDGEDRMSLFDAADSAMYRAKRTGAGLVPYDPSLDGIDPETERIDERIKDALEKGLIEPIYEEEVYLDDRRTVRSYVIRPYCSEVPLSDLRQRSRINGTAAAIDLMILRKALRERKGDLLGLDMSVWHLWNEGLPLALSGILRDEGFDPSRLELSFDIGCIENHRDRCLMMMNRLSSCGVSLSIREFGYHYVPVSTIRELNLKSVKIPSRLILSPGQDQALNYLIQAMVTLATKLKVETIVTDLEPYEDIDRIRDMGFIAAHMADRTLDRTFAGDIVNR